MPVILDHRNFRNPVGVLRSPIIPPAIRALKLVPDFGQCVPGDLVLSRDIGSSLARDSIAKIQRRAGFSAIDSQWTHAAVFLYETFVAEAVPRFGIRLRNLYNDVPIKVMKVRRLARLSNEQGLNVALRAAAALGTPYSYKGVLKLAKRMQGGLWNPGTLITYGRGVICSKVYYDALLEITQLPLPHCPLDGSVSPAHLSATQGLNDIDIPLLSVPP